MAQIYQLVGNTPLLEIETLGKENGNRILLKLEGQNPGGSVKDKPAKNMILSALDRGEITKETHLVEATSGNTGIALAMIASSLGMKISLIMPDSATMERIKTMKAYGAEVILTPAAKTIEYSRTLALKYVEEKGWFALNQFDNPDNWKAHYYTTGPEIWKDTKGEITHFVSAMGTTGTITGTATFLKEQNQDIQIIGAQPSDGSRIPGIRRWSPEFMPKIFNPKVVDHKMDVSTEEAIFAMRELAAKEGVFAGMSSGGALAIALRLSKELTNATIVSIVCDKGDRYLSSDIYPA